MAVGAMAVGAMAVGWLSVSRAPSLFTKNPRDAIMTDIVDGKKYVHMYISGWRRNQKSAIAYV